MKPINPHLLIPKKSCNISGKRHRIPTLYDWHGQPVPEVNAYFRYLAYAKSFKFNSLIAYARPVHMFWTYIAKCLRKGNHIDWKSLDNGTIRVWINELQDEQRCSKNARGERSNSVLTYRNRLFDFLYWAHTKKLLSVPMDNPSDAATAEPGTLSIHEVGIKKVFRGFLKVPTEQEINKVMNMIAAHSKRTSRRNILMFRWASEAGLRNTGIRSLTEAQLPTRGQIAIWKRDRTAPEMWVVEKGEKGRFVEPPLSLLEETYDYLDDISEGLGPEWATEGKHIFYGAKFGPLSLTYVSDLFAGFFALAGIDSHLHRARAYYVYKVVEAKVQELAENGKLDELHIATILRFAADRVGHESVKTLRHYIELALMRLRALQPRIIVD